MKFLALVVLFTCSFSDLQSKCADLSKAADYLDGNTFMRASKRQLALEGSRELQVKLLDFNQARAYSYRFSPLEELGFGLPGANGWDGFVSTMDSSSLSGLKVGFQKKLPNGDFARVRLDWDPQKGAHYNIEMTVKSNPHKAGTYKMAVGFDCNGRPCVESDILRLAQTLNK